MSAVARGATEVEIDVTFDVRTDTPAGQDPDTKSPTLRRYHQLLWSKPLPSGDLFNLDASRPGRYLWHESARGAFVFTSDSIIHTYTLWERMKPIVSQLPEEEHERFRAAGWTIGGSMIWPGVRVGGQQTINQARGTHPQIRDRIDLTLECVRRHYLGLDSPLANTLAAYADFFALFETFEGFVEFFLLQDLVGDTGEICFFLPFNDFTTSATPGDLANYQRYKERTLAFVGARNARIKARAAEARAPQ